MGNNGLSSSLQKRGFVAYIYIYIVDDKLNTDPKCVQMQK